MSLHANMLMLSRVITHQKCWR